MDLVGEVFYTLNTVANFLKVQSYGAINMHRGSCVYDNIQLLLYLLDS